MKVYVVTSGDGKYTEYTVEAVFTDKGKAERFLQSHEDEFIPYRFHVINADEDEDTSSLDFYEYWISIDCVTREPYIYLRGVTNTYRAMTGWFIKNSDMPNGEYHCYVRLEERNEEKAKKIAADMGAKALAKANNL